MFPLPKGFEKCKLPVAHTPLELDALVAQTLQILEDSTVDIEMFKGAFPLLPKAWQAHVSRKKTIMMDVYMSLEQFTRLGQEDLTTQTGTLPLWDALASADSDEHRKFYLDSAIPHRVSDTQWTQTIVVRIQVLSERRALHLVVRRLENVTDDLGDLLTTCCWHCGRQFAALQCRRCKKARYCGRDCQREDWRIIHAQMCTLFLAPY